MRVEVFKRASAIMFLGLGFVALAAAQSATTTPASVAVSTPAPAAVDTGEADFFAAGTPEATAKPADSTYKENFVKESPIQFGGNFKLVLTTGIDYYRDLGDWTADYLFNMGSVEIPGTPGLPVTDKAEASKIDLQGSLYFSARPTSTLRLFGKAKVTYPFSTAITGISHTTTANPSTPLTEADLSAASYVPNISIWELFSDFNIDEKVFFRAGKQMVKWGANPFSFWSPADVISLGTIDVNNRGQDLEGPFAIKANIPFGDNNLDFYITAPANLAIRSATDMGYAARLKVLVGGWELGLGAISQKSQDWKFVATASGSLWKFNIFGEALVNRTAYGFFMIPDAAAATGYRHVGGRSDWFFSGTAGISYANADIYLDNVMLQYYFNGMGYSSPFTRNLKYAEVLAIQTATPWFGMHYLALTAQESFVHDSKIHLVATWIANLNDGSGTIMPGVNFNITDEIILGLTTSFNYGTENTQFRGTVTSDSPPQVMHLPRFKIGMTLTLGTGNF